MSCWLAKGLILGSILVLGPANDLHITGTIFFLPVTLLVITCCFKGAVVAVAVGLVDATAFALS